MPQKPDLLTQIPTGTYQINNLHTGRYAGLMDDNDRSEVVNLTLGIDGHDGRGASWLVTYLGVDEYMIQNVDFQTYASYDPRPSNADPVFGKREPKLWKIRIVASPNIFIISPADNPDVLWTSMDSTDKTPLELGQPATAKQCRWILTGVGSTVVLDLKAPMATPSPAELIELGKRLKELKPSNIADYKYSLEGKEGKTLRRVVCTPGTRVNILHNIVQWTESTAPDSPCVYWLFGPAGSGKTTIAYTIANRFEQGGVDNDTVTLGANFFCSRQFEETNQPRWIVRTIAYHLARNCPSFGDALIRSNKLDAADHDVQAQIQSLLIEPWEASQAARDEHPRDYLVVVDALDEMEGDGGSKVLRALFSTLGDGKLRGIKFFATSRQDPDLALWVDSFERKHLYRLQDVRKEEVSSDIKAYLTVELPYFAERQEMGQLVTQSDGLFIYAATVVRYLKQYQPITQAEHLKRLLSIPDLVVPKRSDEDSPGLDVLYRQILLETFPNLDEDTRRHELSILHTFLCTAEPTSEAVVANLLSPPDRTDLYIQGADFVVKKLHAVLYTENGRVLAYHKSFSDFIFDQGRSKEFSCDQVAQHRLLTESCFQLMKVGLRFNIAKIPSSFILDRDNSALSSEVDRNISAALRYSCQYWGYHLGSCATMRSDPLNRVLADFLQTRALFWIETMNLLELGSRCNRMLQGAALRVRKVRNIPSILCTYSSHYDKVDPILGGVLAEAARFSAYFSVNPASLSTPHLYISWLATWPGNSDPCRIWRTHFPRIPACIDAQGEAQSRPLMTLELGSNVCGVAFSHDGSRIASCSGDKSIVLWDAQTGGRFKGLEGHTDSVSSVAFSTDDSQIVSGGKDKSVRVWDVSTGRILKVLEAHTDSVTSVAMSTNSVQIASGSCDKSVRVWSATTGVTLHLLNKHTNWVNSVAYSRDDSRIVSGSADNSVRIWDALTGGELQVLQGHTNSVLSVAFSPDGSLIASGSDDKSARVWDMQKDRAVRVLTGHSMSVCAVAFSADGSRVVSGSEDKSVRVWSPSAGKLLQVLKAHTHPVRSVAFSPDGTQIISGSDDNWVRVWDASASDRHGILARASAWVRSLALSGDSSWTPSGSGSGFASRSKGLTTGRQGIPSSQIPKILDESRGGALRVLQEHTDSAKSVAFSPDGDRIVSGSDDKSVRVWDAVTGSVLQVLQGHTNSVRSVAFSPDGSRIVSASGDIYGRDNSVRLWDAMTGGVLQVLQGHTSSVSSVAFSPDGSQIVSGSSDNSVRVWNALTGGALQVLQGHTNGVNSVAISPNGGGIASGSWDKSVRVWDASTGKAIWVLQRHTSSVHSVAFSPDGGQIVSGSWDKLVLLWDALTGGLLQVLQGHTNSVRSVAFSPDGGRIVSGSDDRSVRVWDALTGGLLQMLQGHTGWVHSVAFSPDGGQIVSGSDDQSVRVWAFLPQDVRDRSRSTRTICLLSSSCPDILMFVPDPELPHPVPKIVTDPSLCPSVELRRARLGNRWHECYQP